MCREVPAVYFVCHGNTCRSPMAAEIFRRMLRDAKGNGITVDSFGTNPYYPDSPEVKELREGTLKMVMGGFVSMACFQKYKVSTTEL